MGCGSLYGYHFQEYEVIVSDVRWEKPQFKHQDIFRTITIAFQPFIPFTQAYRMKLMGAEVFERQVAGRGSEGYFHWAPTEEHSQTNSREQLGTYPWYVRQMSYGGMGMGRLAAMSVNPVREEKALHAAEGLQGEASARQKGEELRDLLDSGKPFEGASLTHTPRSSRDLYEIETKMLIESLGELGVNEGFDFKGQSFEHGVEGRRGALTERHSGQFGIPKEGTLGGFDIQLEHVHDSFKMFLEAPIAQGGMGLGKGYLDNWNVHSMEISKAGARIKDASKLLTAIDVEGLDKAGLEKTWTAHIKETIRDWNTILRANFKALVDDTYHNLKATDAWAKVRASIPTVGAYREAKGIPKGAKNQSDNQRDLLKAVATLREMTHRMLLDTILGKMSTITDESRHLWSAPLGDHLGMTVFFPTFEPYTPAEGQAGPQTQMVHRVLKGSVAIPANAFQRTVYPIPQIGWEGQVFLLPVPKGNLMTAYAIFMQSRSSINNLKLQEIIEENRILASNESILTLARIGALGKNLVFEVAERVMNESFKLNVKWIETRQLRPTAMAQQLYEQIMEYYGSGRAKDEVQRWYQELMEESNNLTRAWMDAMPENSEGSATIGSEYIIGDAKGNPRKKYLGVFSHPKLDTWEDVAYGAKDATGYNYSISPFITSRRAGTALFGSRGRVKNALGIGKKQYS